MFTILSLRNGKCLACDRVSECYEIESLRQGISGLICPADLRRLVKIATASAASADVKDISVPGATTEN